MSVPLATLDCFYPGSRLGHEVHGNVFHLVCRRESSTFSAALSLVVIGTYRFFPQEEKAAYLLPRWVMPLRQAMYTLTLGIHCVVIRMPCLKLGQATGGIQRPHILFRDFTLQCGTAA